MRLDLNALVRSTAPTEPGSPQTHGPPPLADLLLLPVGNSGESVALRVQALGMLDGVCLAAAGLNNDGLAPRALSVRQPDGSTQLLSLSERLLLGGGNPRERMRDYPLLCQRYQRLLRGVPVLETYPYAGYGGHGHPVISALDLDLNVSAVLSFYRRAIRRLRDSGASTTGRSDMQQLMAERRRQAASRRRTLRIVVPGGGGGSMGNAAHHLVPYLLRMLLDEMNVGPYELWGFVLGPQAFNGLTPFVRHNYRALLQSLDHLARHGQRRTYLDGLQIDSAAPPYDKLFLIDDPALALNGGQVGELDLEAFFDRAALTIYLLLACGTVWPTIASHTANPAEAVTDGRLRWIATARAAVADVDRPQLRALLTSQVTANLLGHLAQGLG